MLAGLSMTVGNLVAMRQHYLVRLLAWFGIAQTGYLLVGSRCCRAARISR